MDAFAIGMLCCLMGAWGTLMGLVVHGFFSDWYDREVVAGHPMRLLVRAAPFLLIAGLVLLGVAWIRT